MRTQEQIQIQLLSNGARRGRISAQIPSVSIGPGGADEALEATAIEVMITQGLAAWKVASKRPGLPAVLYTVDCVNPDTGREIGGYLWMTPLAIDRYGDVLYEAYAKSGGRGEAMWRSYNKSGEPYAPAALLTRPEWEETLRANAVAASPAFAHLTRAPVARKAGDRPKADGALNAQGHLAQLGPRNSRKLLSMSGAELIEMVDRMKIGPTTQLLGRESAGVRANWFESTLIGRGGVTGIRWLASHGIGLDSEAFVHAISVFGRLSDANARGIVERWEELEKVGLNPRDAVAGGGTLWHAIGHAWSPVLTDWLQERGVDYTRLDAHGVSPLGSLLYECRADAEDFFTDRALFGGSSFMQQMATGTADIGMSAANMSELQEELKQSQHRTRALRALAINMIRSGVDPFLAPPGEFAPIDSLMPNPVYLEREISKQAVASENPETAVAMAMAIGDRRSGTTDRATSGLRTWHAGVPA